MGVGVRVLQEKGYGTRRFEVKEGFVSEAERLVDTVPYSVSDADKHCLAIIEEEVAVPLGGRR